MIELILKPTGRKDLVTAEVDGLVIVTSRQPFYDGARNLLVMGVDPKTTLQARWAGSEIIAMRSTVGEAAKWRVEESDKGGLKLRQFVAWNGPGSAQGVPENALQASGRENGASDHENAPLSAPAHPGEERHGTLSRAVDKVA